MTTFLRNHFVFEVLWYMGIFGQKLQKRPGKLEGVAAALRRSQFYSLTLQEQSWKKGDRKKMVREGRMRLINTGLMLTSYGII